MADLTPNLAIARHWGLLDQLDRSVDPSRNNALFFMVPYYDTYEYAYNSAAGSLGNVWPGLIPCPFKYVWSVFPRGANLGSTPPHKLDALQGNAWALLSAGLYFLVPPTYSNLNTFESNSTASRVYTFTVWTGPFHKLTIAATGSRDDIAVTYTLSGTGGYTTTRTMLAADQGSSNDLYIPVPYPWDETRTLTVSWTGGASTCSLVNIAPNGGAVYDGNIPSSAWDSVGTYSGRFGRTSPYYYWYEGVSLQEYWRRPSGSINWYYNTGSNHQDLYSDPTAFMMNRAQTVDGSSMNSGIHIHFPDGGTEWVDEADVMAPWFGFVTMVGGIFKTSRLEIPKPALASSGLYRVRKLKSLTLIKYDVSGVPFPIPYTVQRAVDWSFAGVKSVTIASGTWTHNGTGWESFDIAVGAPLGPSADFDQIGCIQVTGVGPTGTIPVEYPCPPPVSLLATDGTAIPGAIPTRSPQAQGAQIVPVSGLTFAYSDIPASPSVWAIAMTNVPVGYYRAKGYTSGGAALFDVDPWDTGVHRAQAPGAIGVEPIIVPAAGTLYLLPPAASSAQWGNYGKSGHTARTLDHITLLPQTVTPRALSIGANDLIANATTWGIDPTGMSMCCLFQSFTAAVAGTYTFAITAAAGFAFSTINSTRMCAWLSLTDPYCATIPPDASDDASVVCQVVTGVSGTEPSSTTSATVRVYAILGGAGNWAGKDGQIATGYDPGYLGQAIEWRYSTPPDGTRVTVGATNYIRRNGAWVLRTAMLSFTKALTAGQTVYMRIGDCLPQNRQFEYGGGISVQQTAGALTMTVSGPA